MFNLFLMEYLELELVVGFPTAAAAKAFQQCLWKNHVQVIGRNRL